MSEDAAKCSTCGEPEFGEFGWFDAEDGTFCNRCGNDPTRKIRKSPPKENA